MSSATKEDIAEVATSGQSVLDIAYMLDANGHSVYRTISSHCETTTM